MRGRLDNNLVRIDVKIAMQRSLGGFQRILNEPVEFDLVDIRTGLSAHEIQVFAVAFCAVTKAQCGTALKYDVAKHAGIG